MTAPHRAERSAHNGTVGAEVTKVFISYSRQDVAFVDRLADALQTRSGLRVYRDTEDILPTEEWRARLANLIEQADAIVFCLSPRSVASEICAWEVSYAEGLRKRIAPVVIEEVSAPIPEALSKRNFVFLRHSDDFDDAVERLVAALLVDIAWIREHTRLIEQASRWARQGRRDDRTLRHSSLAEAEAWVKFRPPAAPELPSLLRDYLAASRHAEESGKRTERRVRTAIMSLLTSIILGLLGWINQDYLKERWHWYRVDLPYIAANITPHLLAPEKEKALASGQTFRECARMCPEMVVVRGGSFTMGSTNGDPDERPPHEVTIKDFAVGKFELTQDEWQECVALGGCMAATPDFGIGRQPMIRVTWTMAQDYVRWLTKFTGKRYRLLSEAEWEYAARAGSTGDYSFGETPNDLCEHGNVRDKAGQRLYPHWSVVVDCDDAHGTTAPVGTYKANAWGLHDMHGNVWEWVEDCWNDNYFGALSDGSARRDGDCSLRVQRGGSWDNGARDNRSANRYRGIPGAWAITLGFRLARDISR
jgi:formylglycine-generating enzyme required for sulfatase activity